MVVAVLYYYLAGLLGICIACLTHSMALLEDHEVQTLPGWDGDLEFAARKVHTCRRKA